MFLDEDKPAKSPKLRESRAMFLIAMTALAACVLMVVSLMSPPAVALDTIKTSGIGNAASQQVQPAQK
ncbi:hypothetical protein GR158_02220 [Shinella sp. AETb1-6]|jgi:hypothetical protein|uniref:Uncharacterized protein n=2 Tax=Shinella TaxID=323620 RepID=A0AA50CMV7_9HYPH|nr:MULTISPECIES: hypothetical protein [Shinella]MDP9590872.1 hypothetical protein [Shinella zoogloeoides]MCD1263378.1 hypothetical protein [Shinella sumterensis]MXN49919.1 hypothetical protein [Shinella sp. AETb1-6]TFE99762.1 hypothetical protein B5M44_03520 [Shinella sumterensis]UPA23530.1 hypothetical protein K6301_10025 [Shinella oryzae]